MTVRIGARVRAAIYACGAGVWLSGGWWLALHFFGARQGEFGAEVNPLEPWSLKAHGAFAFACIWLLGLLWGTHVKVAWPRSRRRVSGAALTGMMVWLTVSGYLLYYAGGDAARQAISLAHWGIGLGAPVLYGLHRMQRRRVSRPAAGGRRSGSSFLSEKPRA
ncbi:MAG TPA: hypothetical protein VEF06_00495 [Bryobacteraceae bacterium]|nr:hypothetical protein [Bryobacteraceae bacterium]